MIKTKTLLICVAVLFSAVICFAQETQPWLQSAFDIETEAPPPETVEKVEEPHVIPDDDGLVSVNFQKTDIKQVIKVLGDLTETTIIPVEGLSGTITIESLEKVTPDVVKNILESALMIKGFTVIKSGSALKVVPLPETKQTNVAVNIGTSPLDIKEEDIAITQVMPLKYASALKLKTTLQPLVGKHGNVLANERTNTLIVTDISANIKRLATIIAQVERPLPSEVQVQTFFLNYGDAKKIAKILNNLSTEEKDTKFSQLREITGDDGPIEIFGEIQAYEEEETSSIVVATAPVNLNAIERLIKKLDVFPPQAMIEVVILDVTLDDDFSMGIEYGDTSSPTSVTSGVKSFFTDDNRKTGTFHSLLGLTTDSSTAGFTYRVLNEKNTIQALGFILNSQESSKVISTPKILASNNLESSITVGQEIPIIESSTTDLSNNVTNVDYRYEDVGLNLKVTPRISQDGYVNMKIHAELKDLSAQTLFNASIINTREADATVIIPDGHTVLLGGLIRDNNSVIEKKVPILGDIPLLGVLFKKTTTALLRTELILFITPHIIKTTKDLKELTSTPEIKRNAISEAQSGGQLKKAVREVVGYGRKSDMNLI